MEFFFFLLFFRISGRRSGGPCHRGLTRCNKYIRGDGFFFLSRDLRLRTSGSRGHAIIIHETAVFLVVPEGDVFSLMKTCPFRPGTLLCVYGYAQIVRYKTRSSGATGSEKECRIVLIQCALPGPERLFIFSFVPSFFRIDAGAFALNFEKKKKNNKITKPIRINRAECIIIIIVFNWPGNLRGCPRTRGYNGRKVSRNDISLMSTVTRRNARDDIDRFPRARRDRPPDSR